MTVLLSKPPAARFAATAALLALAGAAQAAGTATVDFSNGAQGWTGPQGIGGTTTIDTALGNGAPSLHTVFNNFFITFANSTNPAFIGDYTASPSVTLSLDVLTNNINFFGQNVSRSLVVELRDYDAAVDGYPYSSVWFNLGTLSAATPGWQHLSVTIADTHATALPAGWGGYGAENPTTFEPELPAGMTFAGILAGVDEIVFTTAVPGYFYGFTDFDVAIDNISITAVPEPAPAALLGLGLLTLVGAGRLRRRG